MINHFHSLWIFFSKISIIDSMLVTYWSNASELYLLTDNDKLFSFFGSAKEETVVKNMNKNNRKKYLVFGIYSVGAFILTLIIFIYSNTKSHNDPLKIVTVTVNERNSNYCVQSLNMGKFFGIGRGFGLVCCSKCIYRILVLF